MKNHVLLSLNVFRDGCRRAFALRYIHQYMSEKAPPALNCDDILRSSVVMIVSSFDLYIHELIKGEILYRIRNRMPIRNFKINVECLHMSEVEYIRAVEDSIRIENSYKSFVSPDKMAEALRLFIVDPWEKISFNAKFDASFIKSNLKSIVNLRNRIAHEADVNPNYGGVELWPIYSIDVDNSINFLQILAEAIAVSISDFDS